MKETTWRQLAAAGVANIAISAVGFAQGWTSPVREKLDDIDQSPLDIVITPDQAAWIASLMLIGCIFGPFLAAALMLIVSRKWTLIVSSFPMLLGLILIASAMNIWMIYIGRLLTGLSITMMFTVSPMYCAEISTDDMRGALGSFLALFITFGVLLVYSVGPFVSYVGLALVGIGQLLLFIVLGVFLPESPVYLLTKSDREGAAASLMKLRGRSRSEVEEELNQMTENASNAVIEESKWSDLFERGNFKAFYIICALITAQQFSGITAVLFFMTRIFTEAGSSLEPAIASIIVGFVNMAATGTVPLLVDRLGRRILLLTSMAGSAIGLLVLGIYFYLSESGNPAVESLGFLPLVATMFYIILYGIGLGPLPWTVLGELFSIEIKNKGAPVATIYLGIVSFLVTRFFEPVSIAVGMATTFWILAGCCVLFFVFTYFVLPETKGKSYQEIQDTLRGKKTIFDSTDMLAKDKTGVYRSESRDLEKVVKL